MNKNHKELLDYIKKTDEMGVPRLQAFNNFAITHNLKCETIRNLYYTLVREYGLQKEFKIKQSNHFGDNELKLTMKNIINELNSAKSLRSACYNVSNGNAKVMLRLQNKFRSLLKNNPQLLKDSGYQDKLDKVNNFLEKNKNTKERIIAKSDSFIAKNSNIRADFNNNIVKNDNYDNSIKNDDSKILRMPNKNFLSDSDINNLFMGLVRMVKRNAIENAPKALKNECDIANANLKDALIKLGVSTRKLEIIKCENYELKKRLEDSERLLRDAQADIMHLLKKIDSAGKIEDLKKFLQEYKRNNKTKIDSSK